jgi:hypothetical protein
MESLPHRFRNQNEDIWAEPADIGSAAAPRIQRFKHDVVFNLFLRNGTMWEEIRTVRERWAISSTERVPPDSWPGLHYPEDGWPDKYDAAGEQASEWIELASGWSLELLTLARRLVPEVYRPTPIDETGWASFLSACILFDPPETKLPLFAQLGGPRPLGLSPTDESWRNFGLPPYVMLASPTRTLRDGDKTRFIEGWFWRQVIERIGERFLEPAGLDIHEMMRAVMEDSPDLFKQREELRDQETPPRHYIAVDEKTTDADVRRAFRLISATLPERPEEGAPRRDPLIALQCAILYDRHNQADPADGRVWKWTHEKLAEEFGLKSAKVAKEYVNLGRESLKKKFRAQ